MTVFKSLLDGAGAAIGAVVFAVLPSFIQQYVAALSACQSELSRIVTDAGSRPDAMPPDYLATMQHRASWCGDAAQALDASLGLERLVAFVRHFDLDIAHATLRVFRPAFQMSLDGFYFFAAGILVGLIAVNVVAFPFRRLASARSSRKYR